MPICKNCHRTISKFDNDMCPYCGTANPIEDNYKTNDVTSFIQASGTKETLYKSKSSKMSGLLCAFLGYFGVHNFYLGFKKKAIIELLISLVAIVGIGITLFLLVEPLKNILAFLIPFALVWLVYIVRSFHYFNNDSLVDSTGELLR